MNELKSLSEQVRHCEQCPLFRQISVFPSIGVGSVHPDYIFVLGGVDPEALLFNKPFGSRDETILLAALKKAEIDKNKCYVSPIIRCGNITNHKKYVEVCSDWLVQEINLLRPKALFFLGAATYKAFLKLHPENTIKTFGIDAGLTGIFNRNSLFNVFVSRLIEMKNS